MATPLPGGEVRCGADDPARPQDTPPRIHLPGSGPEIRAYSLWVNGCICAELRRVREERGISAYALALRPALRPGRRQRRARTVAGW